MAHGQNASEKHNRKELTSKRNRLAWCYRSTAWSKRLSSKRDRRTANAEIRAELAEYHQNGTNHPKTWPA